MAKANKVEAAPAMQGNVATAAATARYINVMPGLVFGGARGAWYSALLAAQGQTVSAFVASVLANPPSTPARGKLAGRCEPPAGWLRYFASNRGLLVLTYTAEPHAQYVDPTTVQLAK